MRPLASIILLTFNQERYVAAALRSAFTQTYRPLEIVVSDDAGSDAEWRIVQAVATECPHDISIRLRRNITNMGIAANFVEAVANSQGSVIIPFADDDVSLPDRVSVVMRAFEDESVYAISMAQTLIDADDNVIGSSSPPPSHSSLTLARTGHSADNGAAAAYRRTVFDAFGPIMQGVMQEDVVLYFRAALLGKIVAIPDRLVLYRQHPASITSRGRSPESAAAFARRTRSYVESIIRVRQQQILDAESFHAPRDVLLALQVRMREETMCLALINRDPAAIPLLFKVGRTMRMREFVKAVVMHAMPLVWYRWINRRSLLDVIFRVKHAG